MNKAIIEFSFRRIWRILQISEGVIHLGLRLRWITLSLTCRIATRATPNKTFNEQNNGCARAFWILVHFFVVVCKTTTWNDEFPLYFGEREPQRLIFGLFFWNWTLSVHIKPGQVFRPIGLLNRFTELRHSKVKYKFFFYEVSSPPSPSSLLKLPIISYQTRARGIIVKYLLHA